MSTQEAILLSLVEDSGFVVFGFIDLVKISNWPRTRIHNTLASLIRKGVLTRIKRGNYALTKDLNAKTLEIATELVKPSYISFWTALSHYGFTEQQVMNVQVVSPKQSRPIAIGDTQVEVVAFRPYRFFGYQKMDGFVIAEPEKALIDSLFRMDLSGGLDEFARCLINAWPSLDHEKLVDYAVRFKNRSLVSRLGYLIERLGLGDRASDLLHSARSLSYVPLDPSRNRTALRDGRWRVSENHAPTMKVIR